MARRSLVHAGWWDQYKGEHAIGVLMPNSDTVLTRKRMLDEEYNKQYKADWRNVDTGLRNAIADINKEIRNWKQANRTDYDSEFRKLKFDKQKRYVVESLVQLETKEI